MGPVPGSPVGAEAVVVGAGAGVPPASATFVTRAAAILKSGCFETGSHSVKVSSFAARPSVRAAPVAARLVEVAVVEGREDGPFPDAAEAGARFHAPASRLDAHQIPLADPQPGGVGGGELDPHVRRGPLELPRPPGLGARVEVVEGAPGGEGEGVLGVRLLGRWPVRRGDEEGAARRIHGAVRGLLAGGTGQQIVPPRLAVVGIGVEVASGVDARRPLRGVGGAGPLDAGAPAQLRVAEAGVVAGAPFAARLPRLERRFGVVPRDQRGTAKRAETASGIR